MPAVLLSRLLDEAVSEVELGGMGALQERIEPVPQGYRLILFSDDAVLLGVPTITYNRIHRSVDTYPA